MTRKSATATIYGFNTKPRRQTFLCLWLLLTSIFGFTMILETKNRNNNLNLYLIALLILSIGTFFMLCASMLQLQRKIHYVCLGFIMCLSSILIWIATCQWINEHCDNDIFCGNVRFGFDFIHSGIAVIITIDSLSSILERKRYRVMFYSFVISLSCTLQISYFYHISQEGKSIFLKVYHASLACMATVTGLFFIFIGLCGCVQGRCFNMMMTIILALTGLVMLVSGCYVVIKEQKDLSTSAQGFFIAHFLLTWAIAFCIVMDTKHLGLTVDKAQHVINDDEVMHIIERKGEMIIMSPKGNRTDFRKSSVWDEESCTEDTDLTTSDFSS